MMDTPFTPGPARPIGIRYHILLIALYLAQVFVLVVSWQEHSKVPAHRRSAPNLLARVVIMTGPPSLGQALVGLDLFVAEGRNRYRIAREHRAHVHNYYK